MPDVVVAMASGSVGSARGVRLGHFGPNRWQQGELLMPELFIGGEGFAFGPQEVLGTLLHEAAHGIAGVRGIQDTSRGGAYHNKKYQQLAHEIGLTVERQKSNGWSHTEVPDITVNLYRKQIDELAGVLVAHRRFERDAIAEADDNSNDDGAEAVEGDDKPERAPRNGRALTCGCTSPVRRIRAAKRTIDAGPILCGVCSEPFAPAEDDPDTVDS
ncbi:hypothetical protein [Nocardia salmonicida]|uniref:hypothetical protein n=1 Tax=Nocardia salmonicida TaxID=53431 RepID=UPI002E2C61FF|nr:hypothetical protein [Nocardia salmonicida]